VTKPRDPSSFEEAALVIARDFTPVEAGKIVERGEATIRRWTDPDKDGQPTIHQALRLDVEHRKAFGTAPFLQAYVAQLNERAPDAMQARDVGDLLSEVMDVPVGTGALVALLKQVRAPDRRLGRSLARPSAPRSRKQLKRLRDELDDVEAALKKS
jgi:hypothetical protein